MDKLAPIVLFVYNRPEHTRQTIEYLAKNKLVENSQLFIFSDGPKNEEDSEKIRLVREIIGNTTGFAGIEIKAREKNVGLANSVISGINDVLKLYERVIVLEDDMISSPYFIKYMNDLLEFYEKDKRIFSVTGYTFPIKIPERYSYDIYLSTRASSWGWGTWKNRWEGVDWEINDYVNFIQNKSLVKSFNRGGEDLTKMLINQKEGKIDSWSIIWSYNHFKNNAFCVYPVKSKIKNIGADLSGIHTSKTNKFDVRLDTSDNPVDLVKNIQPDEELLRKFRKFFKKNLLSSAYHKIKGVQL